MAIAAARTIVRRFWRRTGVGRFIGYYVRGIIDKADKHFAFLLAGGLTFSLFVCVIPLVLVVFACLGVVLEDTELRMQIERFIDQVIPYQQYAAAVKTVVLNRINEFRLYKSVAGLVGFIGLISSSAGLFGSMRTILNSVYHARSGGSAIPSKLKDIRLVFLVLGYFLFAVAILPAINVGLDFFGHIPILKDLPVEQVTREIARGFVILLVFAGYAMIYYAVPQERQPAEVVIISAAATTILWEFARLMFGVYIGSGARISQVYGAYALAIIVVTWVYYSSFVFILGAIIGELYKEHSLVPQGSKRIES